MESTGEQIEQIELSIEQAKGMVDNMKSLRNLTNNPDFKNIILDGYFRDEASRVVLLKADPSMQKEFDQAYLTNSIIAIGYLRQYLSSIMQMGQQAERDIFNAEKTREEILAEELN